MVMEFAPFFKVALQVTFVPDVVHLIVFFVAPVSPM